MALIKKKTPKDKHTVYLNQKKPEYFVNHRWLRMTAEDHKRHSKNVVFRAVLDLFAKQVGIQRLTRCALSNPPLPPPSTLCSFFADSCLQTGGMAPPSQKSAFFTAILET